VDSVVLTIVSPFTAVGVFYLLNRSAINALSKKIDEMALERIRDEATRRDTEKELRSKIDDLSERISRMEGKANNK
jgi:glucose-6-phosphate dehydrogenase assembly protein OpcA